MVYVIVAIHDRQLGAYGRPAFVPTQGAAMRSFQDECLRESPDNPMWLHPDDFDLYVIGRYDDSTGQCTSPESPTKICAARQLRASKE